MKEEIRKIIYNNCGIQDGATLVGYIEEILNRNEKAIEYIKENVEKALVNGESQQLIDQEDIPIILNILQGSDKE